MTQDRDRERQTDPSTRKGMSDFVKALLWTAIPILVVSAVSAGGAMVAAAGGGIGEPGMGIGGLLVGLAIVVCIGFAIARKRQIALGILAGTAIGLVGLMVTCFTLFSRPAPPP